MGVTLATLKMLGYEQNVTVSVVKLEIPELYRQRFLHKNRTALFLLGPPWTHMELIAFRTYTTLEKL